MAEAIRQIGVSEVTYYRWRQEFGGLKTEQVKRLKDLETENARLRRAVSDLTLDKLILQEAARGNFKAPRVAVPTSSRSERSCIYPSVAPVRRSGSTARHNARSRAVVTTRSISRPTLSSLPGNTAATAIARLPNCCARLAGRLTTSGSSASGDARG
jgi:putative transposase